MAKPYFQDRVRNTPPRDERGSDSERRTLFACRLQFIREARRHSEALPMPTHTNFRTAHESAFTRACSLTRAVIGGRQQTA